MHRSQHCLLSFSRKLPREVDQGNYNWLGSHNQYSVSDNLHEMTKFLVFNSWEAEHYLLSQLVLKTFHSLSSHNTRTHMIPLFSGNMIASIVPL